VYEALHPQTKRRAAVKILSETASHEPEIIERFKIEAKVLERLNHVNIVKMLEFGNDQGYYYMALEHVDGFPLDDYLRRRPCSLSEILILFRQMLEGLMAAHAAGIYHRDIKPSNILVDKNGNVKIIDFGIAKLLLDESAPKTKTDVIVGTVNYLAPELLSGNPATPQSDLYSLGLVLYFMISGRAPYGRGSNFEILSRVRNSPLQFDSRVEAIIPNLLKLLVYRMISKQPHNRYQSLSAVREALNRVPVEEIPVDPNPDMPTQLTIENADELRLQLENQGHTAAEVHMILKLAARLESENTTQIERPSESIFLGTESVTQALALRGALAPSEFVSPTQMAPWTPLRKSFRYPRAALLLVVLAIIGGALNYGLILNWFHWFGEGHFVVKPADVKKWRELASAQFLTAPRPPKLGEAVDYSLKYNTGSVYKESLELVEIENGRLHWQRTDDTAIVASTNPILPYLQMSFSNGAVVVNQIEYKGGSLFPIEVGRKSTYRINGTDKIKSWTYDMTCVVVSLEASKNVLGVLDTLKVECKSRGSVTEGSAVKSFNTTSTYQYSPRLGKVVRSDEEDLSGVRISRELTGFQL
jgi:serine/threonine protein kinase